MKSDLLAERLSSARSAIASAEAELDQAMGELRVAPRAEKISISEALTRAFENLRGAKADLAEVEARIAGKKA